MHRSHSRFAGGADWSLVNRRVLERDNVTILEIWLLMLVVAVAMILMAWYLSKVSALEHGQPPESALLSFGMKGPTSGTARVCGYNAATKRDEIRRIGSNMEKLRQAIVNTLKVVNLEEKTHSMPSELSGGMKRRLSMAIAIVSNPKIVILDEPTTGMDPETRRNVWDVIQILGKQHTVLLSSHDMEEADAIGDYIIVMALGKAVCAGSTAFLKKACGVGYKIALAKAPSGFNLAGALAEIHKAAPNAEVEDEKQGEVVIALRTLDNTSFPAMFKELEKSSQKLGIESMGVTVASMKDVYLKINLDWAPGGKEREAEVVEEDIAGVCVRATNTASSLRRFWALFVKRAIYLSRSWGIVIVGLVIPLVLQLLTVNVLSMPSLSKVSGGATEENGTVSVELRLGAHFAGSEVFLEESPASRASGNFRALIESEGCTVHSLKDVRTELRDIALEDFGHYIRTYPMAAVFQDNA
ncbi:hypothetical protein HPB48_003143 [Haemaphysalis longicornis]|uniref:ABC transporter domain-containing protein n=1 Tax=Haemaphysalis longicornis TaxID=44386 RepID=A0A9J6GP63_HAELO|nr:hypothetical protein HPB48_003143 [Haemaphysalis longicornis]